MLRHKIRLNALGDLPDAIEMCLVQAFRAAERETDTVQRYGNIASDGLQTADRRSATHVVFGMDFHPRHLGACIERCLMVLEA